MNILGSLIISLVLAAAIGYAAWTYNWVSQADVAQGQVIELIQRSGGKNGPTYTPKVAYQIDGEQQEFTAYWSSNPPEFSVGQEVKIFVSKDRSRKAIASFLGLYGFSFIAVLLMPMIALVTVILQHGDTILQLIHPQLG